MAQYKLFLDESGTFSKNGEKYLIIGGLYFDINNQKILEKEFLPIHTSLCNTFNCEELHGSEKKKIYNYLCTSIGANKDIMPVVFVIDKNESYIFDTYDLISYKYNKAIEWLIKQMIDEKLLNQEEDKIDIIIDNYNPSKVETNNSLNHLPSILSCVNSVKLVDSKDDIFLQFSDIIVNHFSKNKVCNKKSPDIQLLNPSIICFLKITEGEYIIYE